MQAYVVDRWGGSDDNPSEARLRAVLAQFDVDDIEHTDAWVGHESGWMLTFRRNGVLVWSSEKDEIPRVHMAEVPREKVLRLWTALLRGDVEHVAAEPWEPGGGESPISGEEHAQARASHRQFERKFFESLGPERPEEPCRAGGCTRGSVRFSVLCRVHHYESVRDGPCPFADEAWGVEPPRVSPLSTTDEWRGWWKGPSILAEDCLAKLRAAVGESIVIVEHWHYYGASNPDRMFFEEFEPLEDYLRNKTRPGDAIYAWRWGSTGRRSGVLASGKIPNAKGLVPEGGSY